jgi:hypothetical protein
MTALHLIRTLQKIADDNGVLVDDLEVYYREHDDADIMDVNYVCEDLYDAKDNRTLRSVVLFDRDWE